MKPKHSEKAIKLILKVVNHLAPGQSYTLKRRKRKKK